MRYLANTDDFKKMLEEKEFKILEFSDKIQIISPEHLWNEYIE